jgi:hypothetical protein
MMQNDRRFFIMENVIMFVDIFHMALSRCRTIGVNDLADDRAHAVAVAARHVSMAEARKARCVLAEMRWR